MPPTLKIPPPIQQLAEQVAQAGGRAWLVGGGVRDYLRKGEIKDWDVEVFGIEASALEQILRSLGRVNEVGRAFGVFKLRPKGRRRPSLEIDVSIPRRDSKVGPGHRGIAVQGDPHMPLAEAARRRDLTLNAILLDPLTRELADPFGGQEDLARGILRAVDTDTFLEDPLRALRVVQFAARLEMQAHPTLLELCRRASLDELPAERVQTEWKKLLLQGVRPSLGLQVARQTEILSRVFPEVQDADPAHTDRVVDELAEHQRSELEPEGRRWALMLAGWLHHAPLHAAEATLDRLWLHRWQGYALRDQTLAAIAHWADPHDTDAALRHLSTRAELGLTLRIARAHHHTGPAAAQAENALRRAAALGLLTAPPAPWLKGRDLKGLGVAPGPAMGQLLKAVYALQLDGEVSSREEALAAARRLASGP